MPDRLPFGFANSKPLCKMFNNVPKGLVLLWDHTEITSKASEYATDSRL